MFIITGSGKVYHLNFQNVRTRAKSTKLPFVANTVVIRVIQVIRDVHIFQILKFAIELSTLHGSTLQLSI